MPTYQYSCSKCGQEFDLFQPISDPPLQTCPKEACLRKRWGKGRVKRIIGSGAGLIFKGSGFYITDYRSEQYKEAARKEKGTGSKGGEGSPSTPSGKDTPAQSKAKPPPGGSTTE